MTELLDFVSLSLMPSWCWRLAADWLRRGDAPETVFDRLAGARAHHRSGRRRPPFPRRRRIRRADAASIAAISWHRGVVSGGADHHRGSAAGVVDARAGRGAQRAGGGDRRIARRVAVCARRGRTTCRRPRRTRDGHRQRSGARVDSAAHRGALSAGGLTIAVLGSGVDVVYPPEHAALASAIDASGAVISELIPGLARSNGSFRCATGSSAGYRAPSSSSKPERKADR